MNKSELIETIAKEADLSKAQRAARTGKNPRTGAPIKIAAATVPKFSAGAAFKAAVNKKK
ncbi:MAG: hypothetical protein EBV21_06155 [Betaproteobacteria bacterium]|nr:hypothetical protein [Betaproteobacteria bacterium]